MIDKNNNFDCNIQSSTDDDHIINLRRVNPAEPKIDIDTFHLDRYEANVLFLALLEEEFFRQKAIEYLSTKGLVRINHPINL